MNLPILNNPVYTLELPSTGEELEYRPFLVKEQKALMIAEQSKDKTQLNKTVIELINNCTFNKVDSANLPIFDIEYIFIKLRAKSAGETAEIMVTSPDDGETKVPITINLDELDIQMTENHTNVINITDDIRVVMKYPTLLDTMSNYKEDDPNGMFDLIADSIAEVHDGDTIIKRIDFGKGSLDKFIESMNTQQLNAVMEFFTSMPKLRHVVKFKNPKTKKTNEIVLEGINSFL